LPDGMRHISRTRHGLSGCSGTAATCECDPTIHLVAGRGCSRLLPLPAMPFLFVPGFISCPPEKACADANSGSPPLQDESRRREQQYRGRCRVNREVFEFLRGKAPLALQTLGVVSLALDGVIGGVISTGACIVACLLLLPLLLEERQSHCGGRAVRKLNLARTCVGRRYLLCARLNSARTCVGRRYLLCARLTSLHFAFLRLSQPTQPLTVCQARLVIVRSVPPSFLERDQPATAQVPG